jgi:hypothetical protein
MRLSKPERVTLFDRLALAVGGGVLGYLSGLALGGVAFMPAMVFGGAKLVPAAARFLFYYLPFGSSAASALGAAILPHPTADGIAKIWQLIVELAKFGTYPRD